MWGFSKQWPLLGSPFNEIHLDGFVSRKVEESVHAGSAGLMVFPAMLEGSGELNK